MAMHKPPSRIRYELSHPMISLRLAKHLKEMLDTAKGDESYPVFVKRLFVESAEKLNKAAIETAIKKGRSEGFEDAKNVYVIWYFCAKGGEKIIMKPNSDDHKAMIKYMKEQGWGHQSCRK